MVNPGKGVIIERIEGTYGSYGTRQVDVIKGIGLMEVKDGVGLMALLLVRSQMGVGICGKGKWSTFEEKNKYFYICL